MRTSETFTRKSEVKDVFVKPIAVHSLQGSGIVDMFFINLKTRKSIAFSGLVDEVEAFVDQLKIECAKARGDL